jgi:hypothetical protein
LDSGAVARWTKKAGVISGRSLSGSLTKIQDISTNPYFATVSVQRNVIESFNIRYTSLELLNYARIFLAYFLKFVTLNKGRCKTLSFGAIANYSRFFCPPRATLKKESSYENMLPFI